MVECDWTFCKFLFRALLNADFFLGWTSLVLQDLDRFFGNWIGSLDLDWFSGLDRFGFTGLDLVLGLDKDGGF
jgi:hypothetical protein